MSGKIRARRAESNCFSGGKYPKLIFAFDKLKNGEILDKNHFFFDFQKIRKVVVVKLDRKTSGF